METLVTGLLEALKVGGDVAVWLIVLLVWRFDRRLVKLEVVVNHVLKLNGGKDAEG